MSDIKKQLIEETNKRVHDKILERTKADLLIKLITNADDDMRLLASHSLWERRRLARGCRAALIRGNIRDSHNKLGNYNF